MVEHIQIPYDSLISFWKFFLKGNFLFPTLTLNWLERTLAFVELVEGCWISLHICIVLHVTEKVKRICEYITENVAWCIYGLFSNIAILQFSATLLSCESNPCLKLKLFETYNLYNMVIIILDFIFIRNDICNWR